VRPLQGVLAKHVLKMGSSLQSRRRLLISNVEIVRIVEALGTGKGPVAVRRTANRPGTGLVAAVAVMGVYTT
jgi:hypothetical protein